MDLAKTLPQAALAFRGYDVANLGRTYELWQVPRYQHIMRPFLEEATKICADVTKRSVCLIRRIEAQQETELDDYAEAISMIVAVEQSQLAILSECYQIDYRKAQFSLGFSLGEISALVAGGTFSLSDALQIPLALADEGVELARDVTLGILFTRSEALSLDKVKQLLTKINALGQGVVGVSTRLSPNSLLVMGNGKSIELLKSNLNEIAPKGIHLRANENRWPPLHTPLVWEKNLSNRAGCMLHTLSGGFQKPVPNILSLVTGKFSYDDFNAREHMVRWVDHTQLLWEGVYEALVEGVEMFIHLGPAPNIIPATLNRLASNVEAQTKGSRRMQALSAVINRPWLKSVLPRRAALLRAPKIKQVILEDWLIDAARS
jgi:[acyl-carrier-protein] S-malonyltransferase